MGTGAFDEARLGRLHEVLARHVDSGTVPGLTWLVARHGEVHAGVAGTLAVDGAVPVEREALFRISSMSKPVTAAAALVLVEETRIRLDDPVDEYLPELADRRVLTRPDAALDDTVPAARPVTLRDLLTFRFGLGMDFAASGPQTAMQAMVDQGIAVGPPAPGRGLEPDEWMRRLGTIPLERQPGERWLYHTSAEVLSVLVARVAGRPFPDVLRERIFEPLGMRDTGFAVSGTDLERFGSLYWNDPETGERTEYDAPDGQWSVPPRFPNGADGLVTTVDDYLAFAEMLLRGGEARGARILSRPSVRAMTSDQLTDEQRRTGPDPTGATGFGFGVGVCVRGVNPARGVGCYGWDGGMGSTWSNDPGEDLVGVLLTNQAFSSPMPPAVVEDFWTATYAAIAD
jgi:CubicO group peptidase (beta-lactamase class C family)